MPPKSPTIDMHCHPSMKTWLFNSNFEDDHLAFSRDFFPTDMRVDYPKMVHGKVDLIMSAVYLTEYNLLNDCKNITQLSKTLFLLWKDMERKVERADKPDRPFEQTIEIIEHFEKKIEQASNKGCKVAVVKNYDSIETNLNKGNKIILHTIEGAHSLGRSMNGTAPDYIANLDELFNRGVCMITLGHFYSNDIVAPVEAIPDSMRKELGCLTPKDLTLGLTQAGEKVVQHMFDIGMIVDLTHSTPVARKRIFEINDSLGPNKRPLVFSHVGTNKYFNHPMNPTDDEILKIQECDGVIGIIFYTYWLMGNEEGDPFPTFIDFNPENGMEYLIRTIDHIHSLTGSFDNIAIGTDFDGFTDPPDDLYNTSKIDLFRNRLSNKYGAGDAEKILGGNVLRVLQKGWGKI